MQQCRTFWNYFCIFPILLSSGISLVLAAVIVFHVSYHPAQTFAASFSAVDCHVTNFSVQLTPVGFVGIGNVHFQNCSWWTVQLFVCEFGKSSADCVQSNSQIFTATAGSWTCFLRFDDGCTQPVPRLNRPNISGELFAVVILFVFGGIFILGHVGMACMCYAQDKVDERRKLLREIQVEGAPSSDSTK